MNNKLTLRMDESLIASAKNYAAAHGSSVSQMVANYFAALAYMSPASPDNSPSAALAHSAKSADVSGPLTRRLTGLLKPPPGHRRVAQESYHAYLERKHLGTPEREPQ